MALSKHVASPLPKLGAPHRTKPLIPLCWLFAAGGSGATARDRGCFRLGWLEAHGGGCRELEECTNPRVQSGHPKCMPGCLGGCIITCGSGYEIVLQVIPGDLHRSWGAGRAVRQGQPSGTRAQRLLSCPAKEVVRGCCKSQVL